MFERELIGIIGIIVLFALLLLRVPVAISMVTVGIGGNYVLSLFYPFLKFGPYLKQFKTLLWGTVSSYELSVVPLFILMGYLANHSQLSRHLFQGLNAIFGRFRGGVAIASINACAGFGAVCGSSIATTSTMGKIALPELQRLNYSPQLATGTLAAGGTLGILIPPSIVLVIYALIVEASIVQMFQAAIIPGLIAVLLFTLVITVLVRLKPALAPQTNIFNPTEKRQALLRLIPVLIVFGSLIVGLGLGLFTPIPAASVGVMIVLLYGFTLRLKGDSDGLSLSGVKISLLDTAKTTAMIYLILFGAEIIKGFLTRTSLPSTLGLWASSSDINPWIILVMILIIFIILGCFIDSLSIILIAVPFFWPALIELNGGEYTIASNTVFGMDTEHLKIWFGIIILIVVELGLITPPIGLNVFIIHSLSETIQLDEIFKGVLPFFTVELIRIALLLIFPTLCLFLPYFLNRGFL